MEHRFSWCDNELTSVCAQPAEGDSVDTDLHHFVISPTALTTRGDAPLGHVLLEQEDMIFISVVGRF